MTTIKTTDGREIVLGVLLEVLEKGTYNHAVLRQTLNKHQYLERPERAFTSRVTEGTLEYLIQIDYILNEYSKVKVNKMKPLIRNLMRMSVYQILYMDRIPDPAVCNEAVKLAVKRKLQGLKGFVNGVLRIVAREKDNIIFPPNNIRHSAPKWLYDKWAEPYEAGTLHRVLEQFLVDSPMTVRCNLHLTSKEQIVESLAAQKVTVRETAYIPEMSELTDFDYPESLDAFQKGWIQVQDVSSALVGLAAAPKKGDYCIDVCGAPGSKSLHLAGLLDGTGHVDVRDSTEYKVQMIQEHIDRTGYTNIKAKVWDALELDDSSIRQTDIVLADLSCSGLGILGRKPDIRNRVTPEDLESLAALQRQMLSVVWQYVKPGGTLVFSTCTINRQENEENAAWFAGEFPFEPANAEGRLGEKLEEATMKQGYIQLLPEIRSCDGFFLSVFRRTS